MVVHEQAKLLSHQDCLGTTGYMKLAEDAADMRFCGYLGDAELIGNLAIAHTLANHRQYLYLSLGECDSGE
jgi:hypothetical protein